MTERDSSEGPYQGPAFLIRWNVLYKDGTPSGCAREAFARTEISAREKIGALKEDVSTWRQGFNMTVGPKGLPLTDRGTDIEVYELPHTTRFKVEDVPPGWTMEKANQGLYSGVSETVSHTIRTYLERLHEKQGDNWFEWLAEHAGKTAQFDRAEDGRRFVAILSGDAEHEALFYEDGEFTCSQVCPPLPPL